jgi:hypothetical protein
MDLEPVSDRTYRSVSADTGISASEVKSDANARPRPIASALLEFIEHGVRYVFPNGSRAEGDRDESL